MRRVFFVGFDAYEEILQNELKKKQAQLSNILFELASLMKVHTKYDSRYVPYLYEKEKEYFSHLYNQFKQGIFLIEQQIMDQEREQERVFTAQQIEEWLLFIPNVQVMHNQLAELKSEQWKKYLAFCLEYHKRYAFLSPSTYQKMLELICLFNTWHFMKKEIDWMLFEVDPFYRSAKKQRLLSYYEEAQRYNLQNLKLFQEVQALF